MRNNDQEPLRSNTVGCPDDGVTEIAERIEAPGHWTLVNEGLVSFAGGLPPNTPAEALLLRNTVPPVSNSTVAPLTSGGRIASDTVGALPPVWKYASRISVAIWKERNVSGDRNELTGAPGRQTHRGLDMSA